ncbi:flagellar filament capping protein FliD, partial [Senegalia sp. (in: firmicutes)]|uniref:flagellar filament capping protein FliD n=1 Tax=Senegalia sp. (in: firmicutes) TaxID=1924098 RepID=UPI003F96AC9F
AENSDKIAHLFTNQSDNYSEKGISHKLFDIIESNIATTGEKGTLIKKAGIEGDRTEFNNFLKDKVDDFDDRIDNLIEDLARKEEYYYQMFAKMEQAMSRMNSQSSWITSQMG